MSRALLRVRLCHVKALAGSGGLMGVAFLTAAAALLAALLSFSAALAHARFDHSSPSPDQVLPASPARVDIYTVQDMQKTAGTYEIAVTDANNNRVDMGDTTIDDSNREHFYVDLKPNLPPGRYLVSFKNVSDVDGDADHGQFAFYVGTQPSAQQLALDKKLQLTSSTPQSAPTSKSTSSTGWIVVWIIVGAVVVILAGAAYYVWRARRRRPRI